MKTILLPIIRSIVRLKFRQLLRPNAGDERPAVGLVAIAPVVIITAVALALTPPARAQSSLNSSALSDPRDTAPPAVADPPADVPIDSGVPLATPASATGSDDSAADGADWSDGARSSDSDAADDEDSDNRIPSNKVLELPQVFDPASGQPTGAQTANGQPASGQTASGDDQTATGGDDSSLPDSDQVGSINDYQDENDPDFPGYAGSVPAGSVNPYAVSEYTTVPVSPIFLPRYIVVVPMGGIAGAGMNGMNSGIMTTSPMFPMHRGFVPMRSGFGFHSFRR